MGRMASEIMLTLLLTSVLLMAFNTQAVKARPDLTIGFYSINYEIYHDSLVSYLETLGYAVSAVDELNFTYADVVYLDYRVIYPLTDEDLLRYVENGGALWVGGEALGGAFLGVTISTNSIWYVGSLSDPRVWTIEHPVLRDVRSIAYPDGAWLEIAGDIQEIVRVDGKAILAASVLGRGKMLWLIDSDVFGHYFLDEEDNRILARNIAAWLSSRALSISISLLSTDTVVGGSVTFTSAVSGGTSPYTYQWYLDGARVSGANAPSWTFTSTASGIYYVYLKVTDANNDTAQSETAHITVSAVAVGGYSIPIRVQTRTEPVVPYIALITTLAAIFTKARPKTKGKRARR